MRDTEKGSKSNFIKVLKKYFKKEELFMIPNILCYFRIILVFVFFIVYFCDFTLCGNEHANMYFGAAIMVTAAYTDFVDGYIARTFDMRSNLGKVLDPIADKLLQGAIALALTITYWDYPAVCTMMLVFLGKELTLVFEDIFLARKNRSFGGACWYGKVSTFLFYVVLGSLLVFGNAIISLDSWHAHMTIDSLCTIAIFFLLLAWILYLVDTFKLVKHGKEEVQIQEVSDDQDIHVS